MIHALKSSVEATLEQSLTMVQIGVPLMTGSYQNMTDTVDAALRNAALQSFRRPYGNGKYAATHLPLREDCPSNTNPWTPDEKDEAPQAVLTVEHTRTSLATVLWEDDCGTWTVARQFHGEQFGKAMLEDCTHNDSCNRELHSALQEFTKLPLKINGNNYNEIDWVMVFGETSDDPNLLGVLQDVLKGRFSGSILARHDDTFAASAGVARWMWDFLEYQLDEGASSEL